VEMGGVGTGLEHGDVRSICHFAYEHAYRHARAFDNRPNSIVQGLQEWSDVWYDYGSKVVISALIKGIEPPYRRDLDICVSPSRRLREPRYETRRIIHWAS
jgi:hypothetical protein